MDMRKSEVFCHAARYVTGADQEHFLERARFFFDYSVKTLRESKTGHLARPLVVLLTNGAGYSSALVNGISASSVESADGDFGTPAAFVPQRVIAKSRIKMALAIVGVAGALAVVVTLSSVL
jgi:hypothetical protein